MPYKRSGSPYYYFEHKLSDGTKLVRSTGTRDKKKAEAIQNAVRELDLLGRDDVLQALAESSVSARQVYAAKLAGKLDELVRDVNDPPLDEAIKEYLSYEPVEEAKYATRLLEEVAPLNAKLSWARDSENLRSVVAWIREKGLAPSTEQVRIVYLRKFLQHHFGEREAQDLLEPINARRVRNERCAWLQPEELAALREIASDEMWAAILLTVSTGLRKGELAALRVEDVDLDENVVRVRRGKTPTARRKIPLVGEAREVARELVGSRSSGSLWPTLDYRSIRTHWERYRETLDLVTQDGEPFRWHDLRHHFAVYAARAGVPLTELRDLLGHSSLSQTERYAIYTPARREEQLAGALEAMGGEKGETGDPNKMPNTSSETLAAEYYA